MDVINHHNAETYEPDEGWERRSLAGSESFSFEWFTKPSGHSSPMHEHENEQVCIVLEGELTLHSEDGTSVTLNRYDSACIDSEETHSVENTGDEMAVGLDVFSPGRSFDFWTNRTEEE